MANTVKYLSIVRWLTLVMVSPALHDVFMGRAHGIVRIPIDWMTLGAVVLFAASGFLNDRKLARVAVLTFGFVGARLSAKYFMLIYEEPGLVPYSVFPVMASCLAGVVLSLRLAEISTLWSGWSENRAK